MYLNFIATMLDDFNHKPIILTIKNFRAYIKLFKFG